MTSVLKMDKSKTTDLRICLLVQIYLCIQTAAEITYAFLQWQFVHFKYMPRNLLQALVHCRTAWIVTNIRSWKAVHVS